MHRHSSIKLIAYSDQGASGPDTAYVVDLFEDNKLMSSRILPGKNIYYAQDLAENWSEHQGEFNDE